ncbi:hypothetical protein DRO60_02495, partial [Candidatus Bathyarchaeota archaeon]
VASDWKWRVYLRVLEVARGKRPQLKEVMRSIMSEPDMRAKAREVAELAKWAVRDISDLPPARKERRMEVGKLDELNVLKEAANFLARELGVEEVLVFDEEDEARYDPGRRAPLARPYRPAVYVE